MAIISDLIIFCKEIFMSTNILALKAFVLKKAKERNLSMRQIASDIGVSQSYFSEILNGKKNLDVSIGNKLADYFNIQRVSLYKTLGWLDLDDNEAFIERFKEYAKKNPEFASFVEEVLNIENEKERKRILRLIRAGMEK
jgi:transcriptional regulator with XRE-family HTH domain